ncbi:hypothetical protein ADUPG1_007662 [Aduncisulcus paluster]|uniref:Uncharacterized protein n=1 Tax=Aduncisulcus paluster TaxID=2918883 RepID=A0ABQ5KRQ5_9EUKA|nr:hypothetical protein ADUPG1_007662 [Aduncisulcus paluster]
MSIVHHTQCVIRIIMIHIFLLISIIYNVTSITVFDAVFVPETGCRDRIGSSYAEKLSAPFSSACLDLGIYITFPETAFSLWLCEGASVSIGSCYGAEPYLLYDDTYETDQEYFIALPESLPCGGEFIVVLTEGDNPTDPVLAYTDPPFSISEMMYFGDSVIVPTEPGVVTARMYLSCRVAGVIDTFTPSFSDESTKPVDYSFEIQTSSIIDMKIKITEGIRAAPITLTGVTAHIRPSNTGPLCPSDDVYITTYSYIEPEIWSESSVSIITGQHINPISPFLSSPPLSITWPWCDAPIGLAINWYVTTVIFAVVTVLLVIFVCVCVRAGVEEKEHFGGQRGNGVGCYHMKDPELIKNKVKQEEKGFESSRSSKSEHPIDSGIEMMRVRKSRKRIHKINPTAEMDEEMDEEIRGYSDIDLTDESPKTQPLVVCDEVELNE